MASRNSHRALTLAKLIGLLSVAGLLASGFLLPYVIGAGLAARKEADRFLSTECTLQESAVQQKTFIYASDGKTLLATLFDQNRQVVPLSTIPKLVQRALIDTEDRRFYEHHGVDPRGMIRALLSETDGTTQGASTLTQQYVKQVRLYQATTDKEREEAIDQNLDRKILEAKCAIDLEKKYSKDEILGKYLNIAFFGENSYGIAVAAKTYFGKTPDKLTVPEAAVLVGLVKNPTLYDPYQNLKAARERRDQVIQNMVTEGDISQADADKYKQSPITLATKSPPPVEQGCAYFNLGIKNGGFFCDYVVNWLIETGGITRKALLTGGLRIVTSLDAALQNTGQAAVWRKFSASSPATVVSPSVDPNTGRVLTMITSKIYDWGLQHQGKKDPRYTTNPLMTAPAPGTGSTYKYFTLIAALTAGVKPEQKLTTAGSGAYTVRNCKTAYKPENAGNYPATMTLRDATVASSNTFFVGVEDQIFDCDLSTIVKTALNLGMNALNNPAYDPETGKPTGRTVAEAAIEGSELTFTLGQVGTSPLELSSAYAIAANDGVYCPPRPVLSIKSASGKAVKFTTQNCVRKMDPWVARTAVDIMKGDTVSGTAGGPVRPFYQEYGREDHWIASKTGTNNAATCNAARTKCEDNGFNSAIWFVGLTPTLVSATGVYNPEHPSNTLEIPNVYNSGSDIFGAYAANYYLAAYGKYIGAKSWHWPLPSDVPDGDQVPSVVGRTEAAAVQILTAAGFKPEAYPIACGSKNLQGTVAYNGPGYAKPGSTVYYCMSNGKAPYVPPKKKPKKSDSSSGSGSGSGSGGTSSSPGGGGPGGPGGGPGGGGGPRGH